MIGAGDYLRGRFGQRKRDYAQVGEIFDQAAGFAQRSAIGYVKQDNVDAVLGDGIVDGVELAARHCVAFRLRVEAGGNTFREQPHRRIDNNVEDNAP
jgi:hypothetical protein